MSYTILVNDAASGGSEEVVLFSSMKPSFVCHGYWWMAHMHLGGGSIGFDHRGVGLWNDSLCVE